MHALTLFPHIIVFVIMCANACYFGGGGGGGFILVDVENWLDNVRMYNGYMKNKTKEKKMSLTVG